MLWRRIVRWCAAGTASIAALVYSARVWSQMRLPPAAHLHWDPRILVVVCAAGWLVASVVVALTEAKPWFRIATWTLSIAGIGGASSGMLSPELSVLLCVATLIPVFSDLGLQLSAMAVVTTIGHAIALAGWGHPVAAVSVAVLGAVIVGITVWLHFEFAEWDRQNRLFDQARWAASQYAQVNASILNRIDQGVEIARLRERERIAREVHDTVGYALTASLVQLRAARRLMSRDPGSADSRMAHIEEMINDSLQDVRREVSNLRDESAVRCVGASRWRRLCDVFSVSTGIRVSVTLPEDLEVVSEEISEVVYRIIQESLTNAYRHGGADHVDVSAVWKRVDGLMLLRVSDNGRGATTLQPGNGLSGMRERIEALSGTVAWQTMAGRGFDVGVEIPWKGASDGQDKGADRGRPRGLPGGAGDVVAAGGP